jgi:hypothetical protein
MNNSNSVNEKLKKNEAKQNKINSTADRDMVFILL